MRFFKRKQCALEDYTENMLPQTRKAVFFDVLKLHWKRLLLLGLLMLVFCLPLILTCVIEQLVFLESSSYESTQEELLCLLSNQSNIFALIKIPCFVIAFVCIAGIIKVIRQYAWEENVFFACDFSSGIKSNSLYMVFVGAIIGLMNLVASFCSNQVGFAEDNLQSIMLYLPLLFFVLIVIPLTMYMPVCISIYGVKLGTLIRMGVILFVKRPFQTYLAILCCLPLFTLIFIPNMICNIVGYLITPVIFPVFLSGWYLFVLNGLDSSINREYYPDLIGRGISKSEGDS